MSDAAGLAGKYMTFKLADEEYGLEIMFADTGVPALFHAMYRLGCRKQDLVVLLTIFRRAGITIRAEDVGGAKSRTARLHVATGRCTISSSGEEVAL